MQATLPVNLFLEFFCGVRRDIRHFVSEYCTISFNSNSRWLFIFPTNLQNHYKLRKIYWQGQWKWGVMHDVQIEWNGTVLHSWCDMSSLLLVKQVGYVVKLSRSISRDVWVFFDTVCSLWSVTNIIDWPTVNVKFQNTSMTLWQFLPSTIALWSGWWCWEFC